VKTNKYDYFANRGTVIWGRVKQLNFGQKWNYVILKNYLFRKVDTV
jgi:hypothetical protein